METNMGILMDQPPNAKMEVPKKIFKSPLITSEYSLNRNVFGSFKPNVAVIGKNEIHISWKPQKTTYGNNMNYYQIFMDEKLVYSGQCTTFSLSKLLPDTEYTFVVSFSSDEGTFYSKPVKKRTAKDDFVKNIVPFPPENNAELLTNVQPVRRNKHSNSIKRGLKEMVSLCNSSDIFSSKNNTESTTTTDATTDNSSNISLSDESHKNIFFYGDVKNDDDHNFDNNKEDNDDVDWDCFNLFKTSAPVNIADKPRLNNLGNMYPCNSNNSTSIAFKTRRAMKNSTKKIPRNNQNLVDSRIQSKTVSPKLLNKTRNIDNSHNNLVFSNEELKALYGETKLRKGCDKFSKFGQKRAGNPRLLKVKLFNADQIKEDINLSLFIKNTNPKRITTTPNDTDYEECIPNENIDRKSFVPRSILKEKSEKCTKHKKVTLKIESHPSYISSENVMKMVTPPKTSNGENKQSVKSSNIYSPSFGDIFFETANESSVKRGKFNISSKTEHQKKPDKLNSEQNLMKVDQTESTPTVKTDSLNFTTISLGEDFEDIVSSESFVPSQIRVQPSNLNTRQLELSHSTLEEAKGNKGIMNFQRFLLNNFQDILPTTTYYLGINDRYANLNNLSRTKTVLQQAIKLRKSKSETSQFTKYFYVSGIKLSKKKNSKT